MILAVLFALSIRPYDQFVPRPDPNNGYEDYLQAATIVDDGCADLFYGRSVGSEPSAERSRISEDLAKLDYLGVQKAMADRYARALNFLRAGNAKSSRNLLPLGVKRSSNAAFLSLAHLCSAQAYVDFSASMPNRGMDDLIMGITFAHRSRTGSPLDYLVGCVGGDVIFQAFGERIGQISDVGAKNVIASVDALLAEPEPYLAILKYGLTFRIHEMSTALNQDPEVSGTGHSTLDAVVRFLKSVSPAERQQIARSVEDRLQLDYQDLQRRISGPESAWLSDAGHDPGGRDQEVRSADDAVRVLAQLWAPIDYAQVALVFRTKLRLMELSARVVDFRWRTGALPTKLAEAAPAERIQDPLSGQEFVYEKRADGGFNLYSRGNAATGQVDLETAQKGSAAEPSIPPLRTEAN